MIRRLRARGRRVGGFLQRPLGDPGTPEGYELLDLASGRRVPLARRGPNPEVCDWSFERDAFVAAGRWCADRELEVIFLQLGPLEAGGGGHWPAVERTLRDAAAVAVLCMRPHVLSRVALRLPDPVGGLELPVAEAELEAFVTLLAERAARGSLG